MSKKLKAFVRFDGSGRIVPSSVILQKNKPKVGNWKEINATQCCNYTPPIALPFDVTANWSQTTPEVVDETSFRTFLESGEDGDGNANNLTNIVITDFLLVGDRLTCNLSAIGDDLALGEIEATSILSIGNIINLKYIYINSNLITEIPNDIFSQYTSLIRLNIDNLNVPIDISTLINLKRLDIRYVNFPINLSTLVNLEILYAYNYEYSTLDVSSLVSLKQFHSGGSSFLPASLDFTNLSNLESIGLDSQSVALTTVNISGCTSLTRITCYNTPTLTTILGIEDCVNVNFVQLNLNGLDQTVLDYIVVSIDNNGLSNGSITINSNPGVLSPTGEAARLSLISKGWVVTV